MDRYTDRFVPTRDHDSPVAERYQAGKPVEALSAAEKLVRNIAATHDPFSSRHRNQHVSCPPSAGNSSPTTGSMSRTPVARLGDGRQVSQGTIWTVGGVAPGTNTTEDGQGHFLRRGTNARVFSTSLSTSKPNAEEELEDYHGRVALALDMDRARKVLELDGRKTFPRCATKSASVRSSRTLWTGTEWKDPAGVPKVDRGHILPSAPFKVLDAPNLRDDFYCSVLAFSPACQTLAVGLGNVLYAWSKDAGVRVMHGLSLEGVWLTSLAFSSTEGGKCILAIGRSNGSLVLKSTVDALPRFEVSQPMPVACLSWRPVSTTRASKNPFNPGGPVRTEDLLEVTRDTWPGSMTLVAKLTLHNQQICGLAWSQDGKMFASGGNDNLCCLTEVEKIFADGAAGAAAQRAGDNQGTQGISNSTPRQTARTAVSSFRHLDVGAEKHRWVHGAAVKAIAFCPWREGLVATGGGSNDKCIHFYHTMSGAALATIASTSRREIAATFGYAQPDHPFRIAVFSWPGCRQRTSSRNAREGCIIVASSDKASNSTKSGPARRR
ncbi:hypothetical protein NLU13_2460 [Sarocladium strictum]|uniref:Uncharacterized protein n=1 Tax=Sarocladium strictum TaxID=5046 RepID=A0AA39GTQ4_SARSR|nr:hypothetical protein NLU13_2460 [Sarocladium strictum]